MSEYYKGKDVFLSAVGWKRELPVTLSHDVYTMLQMLCDCYTADLVLMSFILTKVIAEVWKHGDVALLYFLVSSKDICFHSRCRCNGYRNIV